jgi:ABC-2 type transport system ATP-binding protein
VFVDIKLQSIKQASHGQYSSPKIAKQNMSNAEAHKPVEVIGLGKRFRDVVAVEAIDFIVERGRVIGLLGGNGAGKTTTMSMLMGLLTPTSGIARIFGKDANTRDASALARINFSSPYVEMPGRLTIAENLEIYARLFGLRHPKNRIAKLARDLDLESFLHRPTRPLSAEQKSRSALDKSLINAPECFCWTSQLRA